MKKFFSLLAAVVVSVCAFADRAVIPTANDLASLDPSTNIVFCVYFDGSVCNDVMAIGNFNGWSTVVGEGSTLLKMRPVAGFDGWYAVAIPATIPAGADGVSVKLCQLPGDGTWSWGTQAQNWAQAGANGTFTTDKDGNCVFASAGLYTYYASFQGDACSTATVTIKVYPPVCEYVVPTIAGDFNNWGNDADSDTDMDIDADNEGNIFYSRTITNAIGTYKLRGGYGWGINIEMYDADNDQWVNAFGANVPVADTVYDFRDAEKYRYSECEEPVECDSADYVITVIFPACAVSVPAIVGTFNGWESETMNPTSTPNEYNVQVRALCSDKFKFNDVNLGWDNELVDANGTALSDIKFGEFTNIVLDYSEGGYSWKACVETALEEVAAEAKAVKVIENGKLFIIRDGKRFNAMGMEVK